MPNAEVKAIHPKATTVILATEAEVERRRDRLPRRIRDHFWREPENARQQS